MIKKLIIASLILASPAPALARSADAGGVNGNGSGTGFWCWASIPLNSILYPGSHSVPCWAREHWR